MTRSKVWCRLLAFHTFVIFFCIAGKIFGISRLAHIDQFGFNDNPSHEALAWNLKSQLWVLREIFVVVVSIVERLTAAVVQLGDITPWNLEFRSHQFTVKSNFFWSRKTLLFQVCGSWREQFSLIDHDGDLGRWNDMYWSIKICQNCWNKHYRRTPFLTPCQTRIKRDAS